MNRMQTYDNIIEQTQESPPKPVASPMVASTPRGRGTSRLERVQSSPSGASRLHLKQTYAWRLLVAMHSGLPPAVEVEYIASLRRLVSLRGGAPMKRWSFFAGGGISCQLLKVYDCYMVGKYDLAIQHECTVLAENCEWKQNWLRASLPDCQVLSGDVNFMAKAVLQENLMDSSKSVLLPDCDGADGGYPCKARSKLNMNAANNVNCVREKRECTGWGVETTFKAVRVHKPLWAEHECVPDLAQRSPAGAPNDVEYIVDEYKALDYWCHSTEMDTTDWGGWVMRKRQWWAAARTKKSVCHLEVSTWFTSLLSYFKVKELQLFCLADVVETDLSAREEVSMKLGIRLFSSFGARVSQSKKTDVEWKLEHLQLFEANNLPWPMKVEEYQGPSFVYESALFPRERDCVMFMDTLWPPSEKSPDFVFADVNPVLTRSCGTHLVDKLGPVKEGSDDGPWKHKCGTQVGSGKVIVRHRMSRDEQKERGGRKFCVRLVEGFEAMRMSGYSDEFWGKVVIDTVEDVFYLTNIAGNSYSMFHYLPWHCALMSVAGRYMDDESVDDGCFDVSDEEEERPPSVEPLSD